MGISITAQHAARSFARRCIAPGEIDWTLAPSAATGATSCSSACTTTGSSGAGACATRTSARCARRRESVEYLKEKIKKQTKGRATKDCLRLRVAVRACNVRTVPWAGIVQAILDGRLEVFRIKADRSRCSLGDRLAVRDKSGLVSLMQQEAVRKSAFRSEWIGNAEASEILGVNEVAVWRLVKADLLKKYADSPLYSHFKRKEVESLNARMIFTPEIARTGRFNTFREASIWLKQHGITPDLELKRGGWKVYSRAEVEVELKRRTAAMRSKPIRPPRPTGPRHGPDSSLGKLATTLESSDPSRIGYSTAALILGVTVFAVQKLFCNGHLKAIGKVVPFDRAEVETLSRQIVFVPEIMHLSGYTSYRGVMNWLKNVGIEPLFRLKIGGVPVFDRAVVEECVARPEFARGAHPRWIKRKLLSMIEHGSNVHQASIACGISCATAKAWTRIRERPRTPAGRLPE